MSKDLFNKLNELSHRIDKLKEQTQTEEATKMSFIIPFFSTLGYDVFNPCEFVPEFTADVGIKQGEKVDYAIIKDNCPIILIEAKHWRENLDNHTNQLYRYFSVTNSKFGILTYGIEYRFYTDLEEANKMDTQPFLIINLENLKESSVAQLKKFTKDTFNVDDILTSAEELKYTNSISTYINKLYNEPDEEFVRFVLKEVYSGQKNQNVIEKFTPIVKKAFNLVVSELINDKLKTAFEENAPKVEIAATSEPETAPELAPEKGSKIVTTEEELQAFYIIRGILSEITAVQNIIYKDTESYFGILFTNNVRKWICRLKLSDNRKLLILPNPEDVKSDIKYTLNNIDDLYNFKNELKSSCSRFVSKE